MILDIPELLHLYLFVFLVVIALAWILFLRNRYRSQMSIRRFFTCETCGKTMTVELPRAWARCPACGARHDLINLKEITHGNVDRT